MPAAHLVVFEGDAIGSLAPFSLFRPTFLLKSGVTTLLEKQLRYITPQRLTLWVRPELVHFCKRQLESLAIPIAYNEPLDDAPAVLCDGRTLLLQRPKELPTVHAPGLTGTNVLERAEPLGDRIARYPWQLLDWHNDAILADLRHLAKSARHQPIPPGVHLINADEVYFAGNVVLKPGCVIDASTGPVYLGEHVTIGSNAVLQGPCAISEHTEIAPLANIRGRTSIGPWCKIGGEISATIVLGNSNKGHDGFIGDSYLGAWVNLGAGTMTSNLKNTYGQVSMHADGIDTPTGRQFLGSFIGDYTKTAIGTRLMTGSYLGACSMLATSAYPPRTVKSFRFLTDDRDEPYHIEKAIDVAKIAYARRKRDFEPADAELIRAAAGWARTWE